MATHGPAPSPLLATPFSDDKEDAKKEPFSPIRTYPSRAESINPCANVPPGEGPCAPEAAAEACRPREDDKEVPPGFKGWLDLLGCFLMNSICYGMTNSFGTFQSYYALNQLPNVSATQISWIGSIQLCLCPLLGCLSGPLFDSGYLKHLLLTGGFLYVFSMFMTSIAKVYWQYLLAHGVGVGLGMGFMFSPAVSTLSHHFGRSRYRSLAYGIMASGSSVGGVVFPLLGRALFPIIGFGWTVRVFGFIVLGVMICVFFCLSTVHPPRKKIAILSMTVCKSVALILGGRSSYTVRNTGYCFHTAGACLGSAAIYCPLTFGVTYGTARGFSQAMANDALAIANGCSAVGRIMPLIAARWVGFINIHTVCAVLSSTMLFCWTTATSVPGIMVYDAFYGISSGAFAAAYNPAAASFSPSPDQVGLYIGMSFFCVSFFWLAGTPITAALIRGDNYLYASLFCGAIVMACACLLFVSRQIKAKTTGSPWV